MIGPSAAPDGTTRLVMRLLAEPECEWVEYKRSWYDPNGIGRYASALANSARLAGKAKGYLVFGVNNDRELVGTKTDVRVQVQQQEPFPFWLKKRLRPRDSAVSFEATQIDGKQIIVMAVHAADRVPVRFDGIAYVRIASATPPLSEYADLEQQLQSLLSRRHFEDDLALEHLTADEVAELLDIPGALTLLREPLSGDLVEHLRRLESHRLVASEGAGWSISNLGALMFARELSAFGQDYGRKAPRVILYVGDNRTRTDSEREGTRGYAAGFEGLVGFLDRNLPRSEVMRGVLRSDQPLYPIEALREVVANALVHQDLAAGGSSPMVEIFSNRIEVSNPGTALVPVDRLLDEAPRSRNERLARLMRHIGYCEERGSGIDKIVYWAEAFQLPAPEFAQSTASFRVTMFAHRAFGDMTQDERLRACYWHACLLWATGRQAMSNSTLRGRFGFDSRKVTAVSRLLAEAVERGYIKPADPSNHSKAQAAYKPYWAD